jgi:hypothetical protein
VEEVVFFGTVGFLTVVALQTQDVVLTVDAVVAVVVVFGTVGFFAGKLLIVLALPLAATAFFAADGAVLGLGGAAFTVSDALDKVALAAGAAFFWATGSTFW